MYPATTALMATGTSTATSNTDHKNEQERKRREKSNLKFVELQKLVSTGEKMSQDEILKVAFKRATKIKKQLDSISFTQGIYAALDETEELTIRHGTSLNLPSDTQIYKIQALKEHFYKFNDDDNSLTTAPGTLTTCSSTVENSK